MNVWPLKFREAKSGGLIFSDDAGGFFRSDANFLDRYANGRLNDGDLSFLADGGHSYSENMDLSHTSFAYRWARHQSVRQNLSYVILVPTLRCNLSCGYCQVSRAAENASGYDWTEEKLVEVLGFLDGLETNEIKVEFQGGEPLLRVDLLARVRDFCRSRFDQSQFVVCTNLQNLGEAEWLFLASDDTFISTSLDGDRKTHERQRTETAERTDIFFENLATAFARFGPGKISALPTVDVDRPPDFKALIDNFERFGIRSIYLRPINHQGFARRLKPKPDVLFRWNKLHGEFIETLIDHNFRTSRLVEEYYFSLCLRRVLRLGVDSHVDLRNPNFFASDYIVVDYDGRLYPTDEARMLSRIGQIDLSVGSVSDGIEYAKVELLNGSAFNNFDPDCIHCAYQPFCGSDPIDDISRYGRIDLPRNETWFCGRQLSIFDKIFELLYRDDEATRLSIAHWAGVASWPSLAAPEHV